MAIIRTKIVNTLPQTSDLEANTQYFLKNNEKFDLFVTDNNKVLRQLQINVNVNLLRQSAIYDTLFRTRTQGYITKRIYNAMNAIYGLWSQNPNVWGVHSRGLNFNNNTDLFSGKDLTNKLITVSVDVCPRDYAIKVGLNTEGNFEMPHVVEVNQWKRIYLTYRGTHLAGIVAQFADSVIPPASTIHITNVIYYKNWKVEEGSVMTDWLPCIEDYSDNAIHFIKTSQLSNPASFNTSDLVQRQFQNGKTVGLFAQNSTINLTSEQYSFKCRYLILRDNSTVNFTGSFISNLISNSDQEDKKIFKGNAGDWIDIEYVTNHNEVQIAIATITRQNERIAQNTVITVDANIVLNSSHVGRILQFNNTNPITVDISHFPAGTTLSGVKNAGSGTVTFIGETAPSADNVMNAVVNSSFSLIKNASGTSNLLISNK